MKGGTRHVYRLVTVPTGGPCTKIFSLVMVGMKFKHRDSKKKKNAQQCCHVKWNAYEEDGYRRPAQREEGDRARKGPKDSLSLTHIRLET
jgi:hypothetical protein